MTVAPQDVTLDVGSNTSDGIPIAVAATSAPGTSLHVSAAGTDYWENVTVKASNIDPTTTVTLTVEITKAAGASAVSERWVTQLRPLSNAIVLDGQRVRNAVKIRAFAGTANIVNCLVEVDKYYVPA